MHKTKEQRDVKADMALANKLQKEQERQEILEVKYLKFFKDIYLLCGNEHKTIALKKLLSKHKIANLVTDKLQSLGFIEKKGVRRWAKFKWIKGEPTAELVKEYFNNGNKRKSAVSFDKLEGKNYTRLKDNSNYKKVVMSVKAMFNSMEKNQIIYINDIMKEFELPDTLLKPMIELGVLRKSDQMPFAYFWMEEKPSEALYQLIYEHTFTDDDCAECRKDQE